MRLATLLLTLAAACTSAPVERPAPTSEFAPLPLAEFPGAAKLLAEFDERTDDAAWLAGDRALFALRLDKGDEVVRWLLYLEAPLGDRFQVKDNTGEVHSIEFAQVRKWPYTTRAPDGTTVEREIQSRHTVVRVAVFDADGDQLTKTSVALPSEALGKGMLPAIEAARAANGTAPSLESLHTQMEAFLSLFALLQLLQDNESLRDYFWQVVEKPSVWSVVTSLGVSVNLSLPFEESVAASVPAPLPPVDRAFVLPMRIDVNDAPALFVDLLAADPRRPYAISGGIVAVVARHPTRPDTKLHLQLLAARCGAPSDGGGTITITR